MLKEANNLKKSRKTILTAIYVIAASSCFTFIFYILPQNDSCLKAQKYPFYNTSVDMNVIVSNPHNISRTYEFYQAWGKDFISLFPNSSYRILSTKDFSDYIPFFQQFDYIPSKQEYQNFIFGFSESLYNFCTNSSARWYMRTTEDVFIDLRKLSDFFNDLEQKFDPSKDFVIKGQLCKIDENLSFIHGGAGWVMSRKAAQLVQEKMNEFLTFFFEMDGGDDTFTYIIKEYFEISDISIHSDRFLSTKLSNYSVNKLLSKEFGDIQICPTNLDFTRGPIQLNKVVFWHSGRADNFPINTAYDILSTAPDSLKVIFKGPEAHICLTK